MRNWLRVIFIGLLVFVLAACNSEPAKQTPEAESEPGEKEEQEIQSEELSAKEVFDKVQEKSDDVNSMHASIDMDQNIKVPSQQVDLDSKVKMEMDIIQEPLAMYQKMDMDMESEGSAEIEIYMTEEGFFMKNPEFNQWMKLPADVYDQLSETMAVGADPNLDLDSFDEFSEDFTLDEDGNEYILKLKAADDKFNALIQENLRETGMMEGMDEEAAELLETMEIHQFEYEIFIDKETFDMNAFNMLMDIEMGQAEEKIRMLQDMKVDISKINEIDEIKVPEEVIENAVEQ